MDKSSQNNHALSLIASAIQNQFKALAAYKQFVIYVVRPSQSRPGKFDKIPIDYRTRRPVSAHTPSAWLHANDAIKELANLDSNYGIGFAFTDNDPFWFLDIDNCRGSDGALSRIAQVFLVALDGAACEVSVSGTGLHIIGKGKSPEHVCKNSEHKLEFYTSKRFVALTGNAATGSADTDLSAVLPWLVGKYFKPNIASQKNKCQTQYNSNSTLFQWTSEPCPEWNGPRDDAELIKLALSKKTVAQKFKKKVSFEDLWEADRDALSEYFPDMHSGRSYDESRADLALAKALAYWTGKDCVRIKELMFESDLVREKWDRDDYIRTTIQKACATTNKVYQGGVSSVDTEPECEATAESHAEACQSDIPIQPTMVKLGKNDYPETHVTESGVKVLNTYNNLKYLLDTLGVSVRWNNMSRIREVTIPGFPIFYDDQENSSLNEVINLATLNNMPTSKIDEHLTSLAQANSYHPIVECILKKDWDDVGRLEDFIKTFKFTKPELGRALVRAWMMSAIAAAFSEKGFAAQGVLVLVGKQNIGKTTWVKSLDPANCNAVREGALLDPANKDSIIGLACHWIVELGELDGTFRKSDIARLKAHVTSEVDIVRVPYARKPSRLARRTVYVATVNDSRFLSDDTGNRRWWVVEIESIDMSHGVDMQQVWAEAHRYWKYGDSTSLSSKQMKLLNDSNTDHEQIDPFEELVLSNYDWSDGWRQRGGIRVRSTDVLKEIGYHNPTRADATRMGKILAKLTGKEANRRIHVIPQKRMPIPQVCSPNAEG